MDKKTKEKAKEMLKVFSELMQAEGNETRQNAKLIIDSLVEIIENDEEEQEND